MSSRLRSDEHGVLVVDKPAGMTSAAVVARVKRARGARRVGHTGTLDPMATGVLPICVGEATKIAGYLLADDKAYEGELELGAETDTLDADGEVTRRDPAAAAAVDRAALLAALAAHTGELDQVPPMYSAIRHDGRRLHQLARAGRDIDRAPRRVRIDELRLLSFDPPRARFHVACSKGTYVRSLVADLGAALGCGAHLTALRRVRSGAFELAAAVPLEQAASARLLDPAAALAHLPAAVVPADRVRAVRDGKPIRWEELCADPRPSGTARLLLPGGQLLALIELSSGTTRYARVFTYALT